MTKAKFSVVNTYGCHPKDEDDVYTVEEFKQYCKSGAFIDYDGFGNPVLADKTIMYEICVKPSRLGRIRDDVDLWGPPVT